MSYISRAALGAVGENPSVAIFPGRSTAPTNYGSTPAPAPSPGFDLIGKATTSSTGPAPSTNPLDFLKKIGGGSSGGSFMDNFFKNLTGGGSGGPLQAAMKGQQPYQAAPTGPAPSGKILGMSPLMIGIAGAALIGGVLLLRKK